MAYLFFDPISGGHRPQHVLAFSRYLASHPEWSVSFAVHPTVKDQVLRTSGFELPANAELIGLPETFVSKIKSNNKDVIGGLKGIRIAEHLARDMRCDHIHFMHLDTFLPALALRLLRPPRQVTYSGLYFKPTMHYAQVFHSKLEGTEVYFNKLKKLCLQSILRRDCMISLQSLDPYFCDMMRKYGFVEKIQPIADLASPPARAEKPSEVSVAWLNRRVRFFIFGAISARKGIFELMESLQKLESEDARQAGLLIAGRVLENETARFQEALQALHAATPELEVQVIERYISDEELWWLLSQCTLVTMPYQRHIGFSGVMCWAAAANRPILTQSFGLVGREVAEHSLGIAVDTSNSASITEALARYIGGEMDVDKFSSQRLLFAKRHTEMNFAKETFEALSASRIQRSRHKDISLHTTQV